MFLIKSKYATKRLCSEVILILVSLWKMKQDATSIPLKQVQKRIASATGVSERTKEIGGGNNRKWTVTAFYNTT